MISLGYAPASAYIGGMEKRCTKCGEVKPLDAFYIDKRRPAGRGEACRACRNVYFEEYRRAHRELCNARSKASKAKKPEVEKAYSSRYWKLYPKRVKARLAKYYARHPERLRARSAAYRKANPEKIAADWALKRARKQGARAGCRKAYAAFVKWSRIELTIPCNWCGKETIRGERHRDHIVPLSRGGADSVENLCISCPSCNLHKNAKLPSEFAARMA